jgi:hypothetical protein
MALLLQSDELGLAGSDAFTFRAGNLSELVAVQSWQPDQSPWNQLQSDDILPDNVIVGDFSSISASPEAVRLLRNLHVHRSSSGGTPSAASGRMSVLEFPPLNIGTMLRPLGPDDDLLEEMLDEAWS